MNTNKYGFPVVTCTRCHGTGHFSFNQVDGTMCLKCGGNGRVIAKKAVPAWMAFKTACREKTEKVWGAVEVGDIVKTADGDAEVLAIEITDVTSPNSDIRQVVATLRINDETTTKAVWENIYTKLKWTKPLNVSPFLAMIPKGSK